MDEIANRQFLKIVTMNFIFCYYWWEEYSEMLYFKSIVRCYILRV